MPHVLHVQTQTCTGCGNSETHSILYLAEAVPSYPFGRSHKLLPCHALGPTDPVHKVELPLTTTPVCTKCASTRTGIGAEVYARWQETLARKAAAPAAKPPAQSSLESLA